MRKKIKDKWNEKILNIKGGDTNAFYLSKIQFTRVMAENSFSIKRETGRFF